MKLSWNAVLAAAVALLVPLHGYSLSLMLQIEHRLTALETVEKMRNPALRQSVPPVVYSRSRSNDRSNSGESTMKKVNNMSEAKRALKAFDAEHKGKDLTDAQAARRLELFTIMRSEQFRKSVNKQFTTAQKAIERIGKAARLPHTAEQVKKLKDAFNASLSKAFAAYEKRSPDAEKKTVEIV